MTARRYELSAANTFAAVVVYNDDRKLLSRLGHDHVVRTGDFHTTCLIDPDALEELELTLAFDVAALVVDADEDRKRAGLTGAVSDRDRRATAENMLARGQLHATKYPRIDFQAQGASKSPASDGDWLLRAALVIQDRRFDFPFPISLETTGENLRLKGRAELTHRDLGLTPYKGPMGSLQNRQELTFLIEIDAAPR